MKVPQPASKPMSTADWAQLILLGALWGGSFFFARVAVAEIEPLTLVFYRVLIAAAALHVWLVARGASFRPALPRAGSFLMLALLNNVIPFSLLFSGQTAIGAGLAAVLNATTPFWTIVAANFLTSDEKITPNRLAGILLGVVGTAVMVGPGALTGLGAPVWAQLCALGASVSYALASIFARRFRALPSDVVATGQLTASAVIMALVVSLGASSIGAASPAAWSSVAALGLLSTALAYILYFNLIASAGATNTSLVTLVVPVSAILLGVLFLGEGLDTYELIGMVLIGLGLVTIDGRIFRSRARRATESAERR
ncbi:DMT family transporter [Mesorhizobium koreense]|uniref:DMT family transporter n=1 Tax=Mesorhizobium koreense TaxID=3074855 RepID=UPI00287B9E27|nr:DMT family transporter [Mesorhizobium sp. WR6]